MDGRVENGGISALCDNRIDLEYSRVDVGYILCLEREADYMDRNPTAGIHRMCISVWFWNQE